MTQGRGTGGLASEREQRLALTQLTVAYWRSGVLFAALRLGVFDALAEQPLTAHAVAARCGAARDHMTRLLNACVSLQLLELVDGEYRNGRMASRFLVASGEHYLGGWVKFMADFYGAWGRLDEAVRSGSPVQDGLARLTAGEDYTRHMMLAMHEYAMGPGRELVNRVVLTGRRRLLDVGGGTGAYSILLAQNHPGLEAVVFDLPAVVGITRETVARYGLSDRITARAGNYHDDDLGTGFDVVLLSNMLHQEDPETCLRLLRKAASALVDGGTLIVQLAFLNPDRVGPPWAVLLSLQVLLAYQGGRMYTTDDIVAMLPAAGFDGAEVQKGSLVAAESLILATKAGVRGKPDKPPKGDR